MRPKILRWDPVASVESNNTVIEDLRNEMRGYMQRINCELRLSNSTAEMLGSKIDAIQSAVGERTQRDDSSFVFEEHGHKGPEKVASAEQFLEMEEKLKSQDSGDLHKQLVSYTILNNSWL